MSVEDEMPMPSDWMEGEAGYQDDGSSPRESWDGSIDTLGNHYDREVDDKEADSLTRSDSSPPLDEDDEQDVIPFANAEKDAEFTRSTFDTIVAGFTITAALLVLATAFSVGAELVDRAGVINTLGEGIELVGSAVGVNMTFIRADWEAQPVRAGEGAAEVALLGERGDGKSGNKAIEDDGRRSNEGSNANAPAVRSVDAVMPEEGTCSVSDNDVACAKPVADEFNKGSSSSSSSSTGGEKAGKDGDGGGSGGNDDGNGRNFSSLTNWLFPVTQMAMLFDGTIMILQILFEHEEGHGGSGICRRSFRRVKKMINADLVQVVAQVVVTADLLTLVEMLGLFSFGPVVHLSVMCVRALVAIYVYLHFLTVEDCTMKSFMWAALETSAISIVAALGYVPDCVPVYSFGALVGLVLVILIFPDFSEDDDDATGYDWYSEDEEEELEHGDEFATESEVLRPSFAGLDIWDRLTGGGEASVRMHRGALADLMMQHDEDYEEQSDAAEEGEMRRRKSHEMGDDDSQEGRPLRSLRPKNGSRSNPGFRTLGRQHLSPSFSAGHVERLQNSRQIRRSPTQMSSVFDIDGNTQIGGGATPEELIDQAIGENPVFRPAVRHNKQILVDIAMLTENIKQEEPKRVLRDYGDEGDCIFVVLQGKILVTGRKGRYRHVVEAPCIVGHTGVLTWKRFYKESYYTLTPVEILELKEEDVENLKRKFPMFERVGRHFADVELVESHRIFVTKCMTHALKCVGVLTGGLLGIIYSMQWWVF